MLLGTWPTTVSIQVDPISRNENLQRVANIKRSKKLMEKKKETKKFEDLGSTDSKLPGGRGSALQATKHDVGPCVQTILWEATAYATGTLTAYLMIGLKVGGSKTESAAPQFPPGPGCFSSF